jgi:RHS repeat-associated protein
VYKIVDASGNVVASYTYDAWGKVLTATGTMADINPIRYRGYYYDSETGLYYLNSRYYDPETGRFINADNLAVLDADTETPIQYNLFAYGFNNPINMSDSSGNWPKWATKVAIGIGIIAAAAAVTVLTGGAAAGPVVAAINCVAHGALVGAVKQGAVGAVTGAVSGAVTHRLTTGSWKGAGKAAVNGAATGFMTGVISGAITGGMSAARVSAYEDRDKLVEALKQQVRPADVILFKGSRGMRMELILGAFLDAEK